MTDPTPAYTYFKQQSQLPPLQQFGQLSLDDNQSRTSPSASASIKSNEDESGRQTRNNSLPSIPSSMTTGSSEHRESPHFTEVATLDAYHNVGDPTLSIGSMEEQQESHQQQHVGDFQERRGSYEVDQYADVLPSAPTSYSEPNSRTQSRTAMVNPYDNRASVSSQDLYGGIVPETPAMFAPDGNATLYHHNNETYQQSYAEPTYKNTYSQQQKMSQASTSSHQPAYAPYEPVYDQNHGPQAQLQPSYLHHQPSYMNSSPMLQPQYDYNQNQQSSMYYQQQHLQAPSQQRGNYGLQQSDPSYPSSIHGLNRSVSTVSGMSLGVGVNGQQPSYASSSHSSTLALPPPPAAARKRVQSGQPISKAAIDEYRNRIKADPDPETQFNFAKYLIEAARKLFEIGQKTAGEHEAKSLKRFREALIQESLKLIKKLATQAVSIGKPPFADAQFFYANLLSSGSLGLAVDHDKAYTLYVQASKQNHPAATYRTAMCNEIGAGTKRDPNRAVLFYRKASALGDATAMYKLGIILLNGLLDQQLNGREAVTWLRRAVQQADEDNPHALHELGLLYERPPNPTSAVGPTVEQNDAEAFELFSQAAKLNYAPSQHRLGMAYEYGQIGCPVDPRGSIAYYTRAAGKGYANSELALSGWYLTGSAPVLDQSDQEAFLWARKAANKGLPKAEYAVGYYYEKGIGVREDVEEAKRWYMRASAQNHKRAIQRLTELKVRPGKGKKARPTRDEAREECIIL